MVSSSVNHITVFETKQRKFYIASFLKAKVGSHRIGCCALPCNDIPVAVTGGISPNVWKECDLCLCLNISFVMAVAYA